MAKSDTPTIQRFAGSTVGLVGGELQSAASSPNRNRIAKGMQILVAQDICRAPMKKATTNRLAKDFLFHLTYTIVDAGRNFTLVDTDNTSIDNLRINKASMYKNLKHVKAPPAGWVLTGDAVEAQNPIFELDEDLPPVDFLSLYYMLQGQVNNPGADFIRTASSIGAINLRKSGNLRYFDDLWRYGQRTKF